MMMKGRGACLVDTIKGFHIQPKEDLQGEHILLLGSHVGWIITRRLHTGREEYQLS